ncbi:hypothetical protein JKJ07_12605 [Actinoplanes sp. LDG1-01]|uniref:FDX-ACB domain-containing protein n=2 Tax=Paractinoplanes lichenicola TaxID=2802976 RepID=A0ABS1VKZ6_9ACTN|nr:hypothetical protein [Actinoplanes lichenicola]
MVYRRDSIDRLHTGTPHQLDLWWVGPSPAETPSPTEQPAPAIPIAPADAPAAADEPAPTEPTTQADSLGLGGDLIALVAAVVAAVLPGAEWRANPAAHPYTTGGLEIEALVGNAWVEIGECGVAARQVIGSGRQGLALGLGLDRLLMLRKGIDDIRLLRSTDPRVSGQLLDLTPYRPVSLQPAARRDISVALPAGVTAEELGDRVRELLGADAHLVEEVAIESVTPPAALPEASRERLGIRDGEVNVLLRVVLRDLHRALPKQAANALRDRLYAGLMSNRRDGSGVECAVDDGDGLAGQQGAVAA